MWRIFFIILTINISISAFAIDSKMQMTGAGFSKVCTIAEEGWVSFCNGYIQAVVDSIRKDDKICLPNGITRADLVTITEREITGSNLLRAMNAHNAALLVMRYFYPCAL
jgi:hypothetical protein